MTHSLQHWETPRALWASGPSQQSNAIVAQRMIRTRLSVLVFDEPTGLCQALVELLGQSIATEQLGFVGLPDTLDQLAQFASTPPAIRKLLAGQQACDRLLCGASRTNSLVEYCGAELARALGGADLVAGRFDWMDVSLSRRLADEAVRGAIVLIASAITAAQHAQIGRILLRHGRHDLQTHEFSRPPAASAQDD